MGNSIASQINKIIGRNIRNARVMRGMSMETLGQVASKPLTYQQISKYEKGTDRASGQLLYEFSVALKCPVEDFFHGIDALLPTSGESLALDKSEGDVIAMMRALGSEELREAVRELVRAMVLQLAKKGAPV